MKTKTTIAIDGEGRRFEVCNRCRTTKRELSKGEAFEYSLCYCEGRDPETEETIVDLVPAKSRNPEKGGVVLFGSMPENFRKYKGCPTNWLERWFPDTHKALKYAFNRPWPVKVAIDKALDKPI